MLQRVLTAVVLIAAVIAVLLLGPLWVYLALALVLAASLIEYWRLTRAMGAPAPIWILFPVSYLLLLRDRLPSWADLTLILAAATVIALGAMVFARQSKAGLTRWALAIGGSLWLGLLLSYYAALYVRQQSHGNAFSVLLAVFATIWIGDTAAMLAGMRFGRHPFFPNISPKKTVEGAVAELLASTIFFAVAGSVLGFGLAASVALGLLIGIVAELGDLVESQLKRTAGVKDASQLIPGHGGLLDRIDSLLPVGAVVYYFVTFLHLG